MPDNTMMDLNDILFNQLGRLNTDDISKEGLDIELRRTEGMTKVADKIIKNADTIIKAEQIYSGKEGWVDPKRRPKMLGENNGAKK